MRLYPTQNRGTLTNTNNIFNEFLNSFWQEDQEDSKRTMPIDIINQKENILIKADLPGILKDEIDMSIKDHTLTIKTKKIVNDNEKPVYYKKRKITKRLLQNHFTTKKFKGR